MTYSIITVVYNDVNQIEKTIQSVLHQDKVNIQYIVIDGGSTDGTIEIINDYKDKLDCIISELDNGIYNAMNKGLDRVRGDVVAFLNAGDWYEPDALCEVDASFARDDSIDVVVGLAKRRIRGEDYGVLIEVEQDELWRLHLNNLFCHQAMFIKTPIFQQIGNFDERYKILADYEWNLRAYIKGIRFIMLKSVLVNYDVTGISETGDSADEARDIALRWLDGQNQFIGEIEKQYEQKKKIYELFHENKSVLCQRLEECNSEFIIYGAGVYGLRLYRFLKENGFRVCYIIDKKRDGECLDDTEIKYPNRENTVEYLYKNPNTIILISSIKFDFEMKKALLDLGVRPENVVELSKMVKKDGYGKY